jgi:hypothetical protein
MNPNWYVFFALTGTVFVIGSIAWLLFMELRGLRKARYTYSRFDIGYERVYADRILTDLEERVGIRLTAGARDMLLIPIAETRALEGFPPDVRFPRGSEVESIERIMRSMVEDPSANDRREQRNVRSSLSVIRAFWKNFCNIPPFCDGRERG